MKSIFSEKHSKNAEILSFFWGKAYKLKLFFLEKRKVSQSIFFLLEKEKSCTKKEKT